MIEVLAPPSKSVTQRALVLAALGRRPCRLVNPLNCDDSRAMRRGLRAFGVRIEEESSCWTVHPPEKLEVPSGGIILDNAGTAVRFLSALSPLVPGPFLVTGNEAMQRRPMPGLIDALRQLGVKVEERGQPGCVPVLLDGSNVDHERSRVTIEVGQTSQTVSGLLMLGYGRKAGIGIECKDGDIFPSQPYIALTEAMLKDFGALPFRMSKNLHHDPAYCSHPPDLSHDSPAWYNIEADWTSASYPLAAGWLTGKRVNIPNLNMHSAQGDKYITKLIDFVDAPGDWSIVLPGSPDLVPTLVACALFAEGRTAIHDIEHLAVKECNRILVLVEELAKLGAQVEENGDGLVVTPRQLHGARLDPHGDHRMAMAFGLISLRVPGIEIQNPDCVSKSYPGFWEMLRCFR